MKKLTVLMGSIAPLFFTVFAFGASASEPGYYDITDVQTREITNTADATAIAGHAAIGGAVGGAIGGAMGAASGMNEVNMIVNVGKELWDVVQSNAPAATSDENSASAIPKGVTHWEEMVGWNMPISKTFEKDFINGFKQTVISFQYRVTYTYGGTYKGTGQYLSDISVETSDLNVSYGYKFTVTASIPNVLNVGTVKDPVAEAELLLDMKLDSLLRHQELSTDFYIRGDGQFQQNT